MGMTTSSCTSAFLVKNEDFVTFELQLSRNNSHYTYKKPDWPRFMLQFKQKAKAGRYRWNEYFLCEPFGDPHNGFCVKRDLIRMSGCSCEQVQPQVYLVKAVYKVLNVYESQGKLKFVWPSTKGDVVQFFDFPRVWGVGGTVDSEPAMRSAGTLLSRVRAPRPPP
ncbi:hypothetical protein PoB_007713100 [Plakobranchus ocellatus]|uniref:Uncharacterized protein n=1 Tax=Plakobranchus ocellatus TaxID=259542 RepID=A0AAV4E450_9GAST|nr:hypothetical protein PoB_007713100 [Plakobranchus ocellatus]